MCGSAVGQNLKGDACWNEPVKEAVREKKEACKRVIVVKSETECPWMVSSCSLDGAWTRGSWMLGSCSLEGPWTVGSCSLEGPGMDRIMSATVFVRKKNSENVLKMNGINAKLYRPCDRSEGPLLPPSITVLDNQVAGHSFTGADSSLGILKHTDGSVLKPILKPGPGAREIQFYKNLQQATDPVSVELKGFVPEFRGTTTVTVNGRDVECIVLENVTSEFVEPCIMDIKIGRQTWDPEASTDKIETEKAKYADSRKEYGFCIPGFQVYRVSTGKVIRLGKDYGKKLNKETIKDGTLLLFP
uniref:Kinase n=1 Tax=Timema poppense TaxID=170557 RepID=A0A7R9GWT7_TIMPO|nr:unnamed protein product [Timema poppensis]